MTVFKIGKEGTYTYSGTMYYIPTRYREIDGKLITQDEAEQIKKKAKEEYQSTGYAIADFELDEGAIKVETNKGTLFLNPEQYYGKEITKKEISDLPVSPLQIIDLGEEKIYVYDSNRLARATRMQIEREREQFLKEVRGETKPSFTPKQIGFEYGNYVYTKEGWVKKEQPKQIELQPKIGELTLEQYKKIQEQINNQNIQTNNIKTNTTPPNFTPKELGTIYNGYEFTEKGWTLLQTKIPEIKQPPQTPIVSTFLPNLVNISKTPSELKQTYTQKPPLFTPATKESSVQGNYVYTSEGWKNINEIRTNIYQAKNKLNEIEEKYKNLPDNTVISYNQDIAQQINIKSRTNLGIDLADAYALKNINESEFYEYGKKLGLQEETLDRFKESIITKAMLFKQIQQAKEDLQTKEAELNRYIEQVKSIQKTNQLKTQSVNKIQPKQIEEKIISANEIKPTEIRKKSIMDIPVKGIVPTKESITEIPTYKEQKSGLLFAQQSQLIPINLSTPLEEKKTTDQIVEETIRSFNPETMAYYKEKGKIEFKIPVEKVKLTNEQLAEIQAKTQGNPEEIKNMTIDISIPYEKAYEYWKNLPMTEKRMEEFIQFSGIGTPTLQPNINILGTEIRNPFNLQEIGGKIFTFVFQPGIEGSVKSKLATDNLEKITQYSGGVVGTVMSTYIANRLIVAPFEISIKGYQVLSQQGVIKGTAELAKGTAEALTTPAIAPTISLGSKALARIPQAVKLSELAQKSIPAIEFGERTLYGVSMTTALLPDNQIIKPIQEFGKGRIAVIEEIGKIYTGKASVEEMETVRTGIAYNLPYYTLKYTSAYIPSKNRLGVGITDTAYFTLNAIGLIGITKEALEKEPNNLAKGLGRASAMLGFTEITFEEVTIDKGWERSTFHKQAEKSVKELTQKGLIDPKEYFSRLATLEISPKTLIDIKIEQQNTKLITEIKTDITKKSAKPISEYRPDTERFVSFKPDIKPDIKYDYKPTIKFDIKLDTKPDIKPDIKPDVKPDIKPDIKNDFRTVDIKLDIRTDIKPDLKTDIKPDNKFDYKADIKEDIKYDIRVDYPLNNVIIPMIPFLTLGGGGGKSPSGKKLMLTGKEQKYKPSITASIFGIKGQPITAEGYSIRPLTSTKQITPQNKKITVINKKQPIPFIKLKKSTISNKRLFKKQRTKTKHILFIRTKTPISEIF